MTKEQMAVVRVTRRFKQSAERVFDAWLDPERLGKWLFATATGEMVKVEVDPRVGGTFNITERRGGEDVAHLGAFLEIDRPRRLVFEVSVAKYVQEAERVTVEITPHQDGCDLVLTHEMRMRKDVTPDMLHTGWTMILEALATLLRGGDPRATVAAANIATETSDAAPSARAARHIAAAPERVFDAWLDPDLLGQWMFGLNVREEEIVHLKVNPMVGGSFSFLVRRGDQEIDHVGEYLEIDRPNRLVFTWGVRQEEGTDFSHVVVKFEPAGEGCDMTIIHTMAPKWVEFAERAQGSWEIMADALAKVLE